MIQVGHEHEIPDNESIERRNHNAWDPIRTVDRLYSCVTDFVRGGNLAIRTRSRLHGDSCDGIRLEAVFASPETYSTIFATAKTYEKGGKRREI